MWTRLNRHYQEDVIAIGPLADKRSRVVPTGSQIRKLGTPMINPLLSFVLLTEDVLEMIKLKQPWWEGLHKLWYQYCKFADARRDHTKLIRA